MKKNKKCLLVGVLAGVVCFCLALQMLIRFQVNHISLPEECRQVKTITSWTDVELSGGHFVGWRLFETENGNEQEVWDEIREKNKTLKNKFGKSGSSYERIVLLRCKELSREPYECESEPLDRLAKYMVDDTGKYYYVLEYFTWDVVLCIMAALPVIFISVIVCGFFIWNKRSRRKLS